MPRGKKNPVRDRSTGAEERIATIDGSDRAAADALEAGAERVEFHANPTQHAFILSRADADLFASRVGEGKSAALCWASFYHAQRNPGARHAFIRDTWVNLESTTFQEFVTWFPPGVFGEFISSRKLWRWTLGEMGGASAHWIGMDHEEDASKLQSLPLAGFLMDEPAPASGSGGIDPLIFEMAMTRLRQKDMQWRIAKLAVNNPDESHWTYTKFVDPGTPGFQVFQTREPENMENLPKDYYEKISRQWANRQDLVDRFVRGKFGFQQQGRPVTPEWADNLHLAIGLAPLPGITLYLLWDFGLNPTCLITQVTPLGFWNVLEAHVGNGIGVAELIEGIVAPRIAQHYREHKLEHIGDPAGATREQSDARNSAVLCIKRMLGGPWTSGPDKLAPRIEPLRAVLSRTLHGRGVVQVSREHAKPLWHALRGGWRYTTHRTGAVSESPEKNLHSHPADAFSYGAAILFPLARRAVGRGNVQIPRPPTYFGRGPSARLGFERPGARVPQPERRP